MLGIKLGKMKYDYKTTGAVFKGSETNPIAPDGDGWIMCGVLLDKDDHIPKELRVHNIYWFWQRKKLPLKRLTKPPKIPYKRLTKKKS
jgi:hypothetical protein